MKEKLIMNEFIDKTRQEKIDIVNKIYSSIDNIIYITSECFPTNNVICVNETVQEEYVVQNIRKGRYNIHIVGKIDTGEVQVCVVENVNNTVLAIFVSNVVSNSVEKRLSKLYDMGDEIIISEYFAKLTSYANNIETESTDTIEYNCSDDKENIDSPEEDE